MIEWKPVKKQLHELREYDRNPREITERGMRHLENSIKGFGLAEPIVINTDGTIIGGHARYKILQGMDGVDEAYCWMPDHELSTEEIKELNVRLNKNIAGQFDFDMLANDYEVDDLLDYGFQPEELAIGGGIDEEEEKEVEESGTTHKCPECGFEF